MVNIISNYFYTLKYMLFESFKCNDFIKNDNVLLYVSYNTMQRIIFNVVRYYNFIINCPLESTEYS
jgi:hypothetical protein